MASATLTARLVGDAKGMVDAFDQGERSAGGFGKALGAIGQIAAGFSIANIVAGAPAALMEMAKAAAEDAASVTRLQVAVENSGASWTALSASLTTTIELAQKRAFTDDQARNSLSLLVAQTGSAEEAQKRFTLAMDLSRGANIDLETASKLLGKVTDENVSVLNRYGISIAEGASETELFGVLQAKFGGQSEAFANSAAGQAAATAIAMGEMKESIGVLILPLMQLGTDVLNGIVIPAMQFLIDNAETVKAVLAGVATATTVLAIPALIKMAILTWAHVTALLAQAAALALANPLLFAVGVAAGAAFAAYLKMSGASDAATDAVKELRKESQNLAPTLDKAADSAGGLSKSLKEVTFASLLAEAALRRTQVTTDEYSGGLPVVSSRLADLYAKESALANATAQISEAITGKKAAQDLATASTLNASNAARSATDATRDQERALRDLESAAARLASRNDSLAQSFARLGDDARAAAKRTADDFAGRLVAAGVPAAEAARIAAPPAERVVPQSVFDIINASIATGTIDPGAGLRLANAWKAGTPDPLMVALGLAIPAAHGGIVRARPGGTLLLAGEAGQDEAIVPLGSGGIGGNTTIYLTVNSLDGQTAADATVRALTALESQGRISRVTRVG